MDRYLNKLIELQKSRGIHYRRLFRFEDFRDINYRQLIRWIENTHLIWNHNVNIK